MKNTPSCYTYLKKNKRKKQKLQKNTKKLKIFLKKEGKKFFMKNNIIVHKIKRICTKYI